MSDHEPKATTVADKQAANRRRGAQDKKKYNKPGSEKKQLAASGYLPQIPLFDTFRPQGRGSVRLEIMAPLRRVASVVEMVARSVQQRQFPNEVLNIETTSVKIVGAMYAKQLTTSCEQFVQNENYEEFKYLRNPELMVPDFVPKAASTIGDFSYNGVKILGSNTLGAYHTAVKLMCDGPSYDIHIGESDYPIHTWLNIESPKLPDLATIERKHVYDQVKDITITATFGDTALPIRIPSFDVCDAQWIANLVAASAFDDGLQGVDPSLRRYLHLVHQIGAHPIAARAQPNPAVVLAFALIGVGFYSKSSAQISASLNTAVRDAYLDTTLFEAAFKKVNIRNGSEEGTAAQLITRDAALGQLRYPSNVAFQHKVEAYYWGNDSPTFRLPTAGMMNTPGGETMDQRLTQFAFTVRRPK